MLGYLGYEMVISSSLLPDGQNSTPTFFLRITPRMVSSIGFLIISVSFGQFELILHIQRKLKDRKDTHSQRLFPELHSIPVYIFLFFPDPFSSLRVHFFSSSLSFSHEKQREKQKLFDSSKVLCTYIGFGIFRIHH